MGLPVSCVWMEWQAFPVLPVLTFTPGELLQLHLTIPSPGSTCPGDMRSPMRLLLTQIWSVYRDSALRKNQSRAGRSVVDKDRKLGRLDQGAWAWGKCSYNLLRAQLTGLAMRTWRGGSCCRGSRGIMMYAHTKTLIVDNTCMRLLWSGGGCSAL